MTDDLNKMTPDVHIGEDWRDIWYGDNSITLPDVDVYFRNLESQLIRLIAGADLIVGCVAWLTNEAILNALAAVPSGVSIIVQKEDFLRPDSDRPGWKDRLRNQYAELKMDLVRYEMGRLVGNLSVCHDPTIEPVRCMGNHNSQKNPAFPRMHNKFLVFCRAEGIKNIPGVEIPYCEPHPYAVWTGSFNLTYNASMSLENAVYIKNEDVAEAYYREWQQILALSEPLDWRSEWVAPEWRVGS